MRDARCAGAADRIGRVHRHPSVLEALVDRVGRGKGRRAIAASKIKIKPGWDRRPVEAIRARFGDHAVDGGRQRGVHARRCRRIWRNSIGFNLMMIEQPLGYDDLVRHAQLQTRLARPSASTSRMHRPGRGRRRAGLWRVPHHQHQARTVGRLHARRSRVHDLARARGVPVWHGGMLETGIGRAHNLHLSALPGFTLPGDVAASRRYFVPDLIEPPIDVSPDGTIRDSARPRHRRDSRRGRACRRRARIREVPSMMRRFRIGQRASRDAGASPLATACAPEGPPPRNRWPRQPPPPPVSIDRKVGWILRLEQQRSLTDPAAGADLLTLVTDADCRRPPPGGARHRPRRRRPRACRPLSTALADTQESVRAMAAFGLGLLGDAAPRRRSRPRSPIRRPLVRGRAAEALGQLGATPAAAAIATSAAAVPRSSRRSRPTMRSIRRAPRSRRAGCRFCALVRLRQFDALARVVHCRWQARVVVVAGGVRAAAEPRSARGRCAEPVDRHARRLHRGVRVARPRRSQGQPRRRAGAGRHRPHGADLRLRAEAIRALGRTGMRARVQPLLALLATRATPPNLVLETITALGAMGNPRAFIRCSISFRRPRRRCARRPWRRPQRWMPKVFCWRSRAPNRSASGRCAPALASVLATAAGRQWRDRRSWRWPTTRTRACRRRRCARWRRPARPISIGACSMRWRRRTSVARRGGAVGRSSAGRRRRAAGCGLRAGRELTPPRRPASPPSRRSRVTRHRRRRRSLK